MCKFILRQNIPRNTSSSSWMCSGKASGAFGLDHVFQTASAQSKCDVWAAKRHMACQLCKAGNALFGMWKWKKNHGKATTLCREWESSSLQMLEQFLLPHPQILYTLLRPLNTSHPYFPAWLLCSLQGVEEKSHWMNKAQLFQQLIPNKVRF